MRATFFVVGELAGAAPDIVAALGERHEVASHGLTHRPLDRLCSAEVAREVRDSRLRLEQCGATEVVGFRAPFFRRCRGLTRQLEEAGYRYDASMGSVMPGPANGRLASLPRPLKRGPLYELPTCAMRGGMLPLSLTWLRLCAPWAARLLPSSASLLYLHLHEFLPAETASCLPFALRRLLTRHCGEAAWGILDQALGALHAEFTTCREVLSGSLAPGRSVALKGVADACRE